MSFDSREFRNALGCFATGVCVVGANPEGYEPFGLTVNSFASVSLEPPLVLWSLQNDSEMFGAFERTRHYSVNFLSSEQRELSNQYAKKGDHVFDADHYVIGATGCPIMPAALVSLECEVEATHPGGDHLIFLGRVLELRNDSVGEPLLFYSGGYRELR